MFRKYFFSSLLLILILSSPISYSEKKFSKDHNFNSLVINSWKFHQSIDSSTQSYFIDFDTKQYIIPHQIYSPTTNKYPLALRKPENEILPIEYIIYYGLVGADEIKTISTHLKNAESIQEALSLEDVKYPH